MSGTFKECAACAEKPGSPPLCAACLHNRARISDLEAKLDRMRRALERIVKEGDAANRYSGGFNSELPFADLAREGLKL